MKKPGFTLLELLIVIAVIAALIAICIPALRAARESARTVRCAANIRGLVLGMRSYETENDRFPPAFVDMFSVSPPEGGWAGNTAYDSMGRWWLDYITDYTDEDPTGTGTLWCPGRRMDEPQLETDVLCGNYGVNRSICKGLHRARLQSEFEGISLGTAEISQPSGTLLLVDSGYATMRWWSTMMKSPGRLTNSLSGSTYVPGLTINSERGRIWDCQMRDAIDGRHRGRQVNVGYVDGHVVRVDADGLGVEESEDGYENRWPLWTPSQP